MAAITVRITVPRWRIWAVKAICGFLLVSGIAFVMTDEDMDSLEDRLLRWALAGVKATAE